MPSSLIDRLDVLFADSRGEGGIKVDDDFRETLERIRQQLRHSALSINVSGRLRMLLQKSTKEFFMILCGHAPTETRRLMRKSQQAFTSSLEILKRNAQKEVFSPVDSEEILERLSVIESEWREYSRLLQEAEGDGEEGKKAVRYVAEKNPDLLEKIEHLVSFFENLAYSLHE